MANFEKPKTPEEAHKRKKPAAIFWSIYFAAVTIYTFLPALYPYDVVEPFILGIPDHLFKWFISTILLVGGMIVFELTTWHKWRGDDR